MIKSFKYPISDDLLLQYLEGILSEQEAAVVENAIENSVELQKIVDDYLLMQDDILKYEMKRNDTNIDVQDIPSLVNSVNRVPEKYLFTRFAIAAVALSFVCGIGIRLIMMDNASTKLTTPTSVEAPSQEGIGSQSTVDTVFDQKIGVLLEREQPVVAPVSDNMAASIEPQIGDGPEDFDTVPF